MTLLELADRIAKGQTDIAAALAQVRDIRNSPDLDERAWALIRRIDGLHGARPERLWWASRIPSFDSHLLLNTLAPVS